MKLSRNKIRKLYKQKNQSFKRGKNNSNNQPKRFKKQYTFRQNISDTNSFENNHNDNHTIHTLSKLLNKTVKTYIPKFELSRLIDKYKNIRRRRKFVMRGGVVDTIPEATPAAAAAEPDQSDEVIESTSFKPDDSKVNELLQALLTGQEYNYVVTQPINGASKFKLDSVRYGKIEKPEEKKPEEKPPAPAAPAEGPQRPPVSSGKGDASKKTESSKKEEFVISPGDPITVAAGDPISDVKPPGTAFINDAKEGKFTSIDEKGNITVAFDDPKPNITQPITANRVYKQGKKITIEDLQETQDPKFTKLPLDSVRLIISEPLGGSGKPTVQYLFNVTAGSEIKINSTLLSVLKFIDSVDDSVQTLKDETTKQLEAVKQLLETYVSKNASNPEKLTKLKELIPKQITKGELVRFKSIFEKAKIKLSTELEKAISDAPPQEECESPVPPQQSIQLTVTTDKQGVTTISPAAKTSDSDNLQDFLKVVGTQSGDAIQKEEDTSKDAAGSARDAAPAKAQETAAPEVVGQSAAPAEAPVTSTPEVVGQSAVQPAAVQPAEAQVTARQVNAAQPAAAQESETQPAAAQPSTANTESLLRGENNESGGRATTKGGRPNRSRKSNNRRSKQSKSTIRKNRK